MSEVIYDDVMHRGERVEMMVDIYESSDSVRNHELMINTENISTERHQPLQHTGSVSVKNRRHRAVQVCLWLLCVLLLTAVLVLCVYFTTERNRLLTHNYNLTEEREQFKNKSDELQDVLKERNQLILQNFTLNKDRQQLLTNNSKLLEEKDECLMNSTTLLKERDFLMNKIQELSQWLIEQDEHSYSFKWIYYNFSFYYFSSEKRSWSDSRQDCKQRGADLVIINSPEEQKFLQKAISSGYSFWIGLSIKTGVWKWVDGTTLSSRYWRNRDPRAFDNLCAITDTLGWYDLSCYGKYRWICEKRIFKSLI